MTGTLELSLLKRNPVIEEASLGTELMLFDPGASKFYVLNRTMTFVWRRCGEPARLDDVLDALTTEFDGVDRDGPRGDLEKAVEELASYGLLLGPGAAGK
jgi:hypothetical protein